MAGQGLGFDGRGEPNVSARKVPARGGAAGLKDRAPLTQGEPAMLSRVAQDCLSGAGVTVSERVGFEMRTILIGMEPFGLAVRQGLVQTPRPIRGRWQAEAKRRGR
jgi:hypothetical protein